jgi:hypothetical protein
LYSKKEEPQYTGNSRRRSVDEIILQQLVGTKDYSHTTMSRDKIANLIKFD